MPFYVPVGPLGLVFRFGMIWTGLLRDLTYWSTNRRRTASPPLQDPADALADSPIARTRRAGRSSSCLAVLGCSASQRGPIWWAAHHRHHHRASDTPQDLHSPVVHTLWQSHIGWIFSPESPSTDRQAVKDLIRYPELRWLDNFP
jgi:hypothetical protein